MCPQLRGFCLWREKYQFPWRQQASIGRTWPVHSKGFFQSWQGPHCTGKTGKMTKYIFPVRKNTGNLEILPKHGENTGNFVCSDCKFPDCKDTRYCDYCRQGFELFNVSFAYEIVGNLLNWHKKKIPVKQGNTGGNTGNYQIEFEWGPCHSCRLYFIPKAFDVFFPLYY